MKEGVLGRGETCLGCQCHAARHELAGLSDACGHHAELLLLDEGDEVLDLVLQVGGVNVLGDIWVGGLVTGGSVAERHVGSSVCCD